MPPLRAPRWYRGVSTLPLRPARLAIESFTGMANLPGSAHPLSAIDIEGLRHDIVAFRCGKEHRAAYMIFRFAHAPEGHAFADEALLLARRPAFIFGEH